nr:hypothetical protein [Thermohalobaculum xanthum]
MARLFDGPDQQRRMFLKPAPRVSDDGACLVAGEEPAAELILERPDARAHGRLGDVQAFGCGDEAPGRRDGKEGAGEFRVHGSLILEMSNLKSNNFCFRDLIEPAIVMLMESMGQCHAQRRFRI